MYIFPVDESASSDVDLEARKEDGSYPEDCLYALTAAERIAGMHDTITAIADGMLCWQNACMGIQITIRDVSEKVRDELASRAALQGKSMQEYLRAELERLAARPSIETWLEQVRKRKRASQTRVSASQILQNRDGERR